MEFVKILLAFFLPPVAVAMHRGLDEHFWFNLCLTLFGCWVPGIFHAFYVIAKDPPDGNND